MKRLLLLLALWAANAGAQQYILPFPPTTIISPANNQCLVYQSSTKTWVNGSCASGGGATVTGSPANGNLTFFSGAGTISSGNLSGDCSTSGTGVLACTKTGGVAFAASATTDTTNAANISSGQLGSLARLPSIADGTLLCNSSGGVAAPSACQIFSATATGNTAFGLNTFNPTNGQSFNQGNTAVGINALAAGSAASMSNNTAIGNKALQLLGTNGLSETAVGQNALSLDVVGRFNVALGDNALWHFTGAGPATGNTALGHGALAGDDTTPADNTASANTAVGGWAGQEITTGSANTFLGMSSGLDITTGANNTGVGYYAVGGCTTFDTAGAACATVGNQTGVGYKALAVATTGNQVAVGYKALTASVAGVQNTAVGYQALSVAAGSSDTGNTAVGYNSLVTVNGGTGSNTAVGRNSGQFISTGATNTMVGDSTMVGTNGAQTTGSNNTGVGAGALFACQGACNGNTTVGRNAGSNITTGAANILIGTSVAALTATTSNEINIGGALIGYNTAPTVTSGFGTSPSVAGGNTFAFAVTEGATGSPTTTGVLGMPTAPNDWICSALDRTSASITARQSGAASTTAVTITFSSAPANGDVVQFQCNAR